MTTLLLTVLTASLLGNLHCAGMCGGFVAFYSGSDPHQGWRRLRGHAAYSGGRLTTYVILGAAAGTAGGVIDLAGSVGGLHRVAALVGGISMILWGLGAVLKSFGLLRWPRKGSGPGGGIVVRAASSIGRRSPLVRAGAMGLLTGALPCGWLWAFVITAAGTGHALTGAAVMTAFWLGTLPALLGIGLGLQLLALPIRRRLPTITAVILVVIGVVTLFLRPHDLDLITGDSDGCCSTHTTAAAEN